ncbi:O-fucosyltransferase family protein [Gymnodinialimonas sp.]
MRQIKIGTLLRSERDKRTYGEIFRRRTLREAAHWAKSQTLPKAAEESASPTAKAIGYTGMAQQFHSLPDDCTVIRDFLIRASRHPVTDARYDIAIHFRKGDFQPPKEGHARQSVQLPVSWYLSAYRKACDWLGNDRPSVILFTDGDPQATAAELGIENIAFEPPGNALTSLLAMSQSRVLIPSRSTFSLWAQYLGQSTTFWPEGFDLKAFKRVDPAADLWV